MEPPSLTYTSAARIEKETLRGNAHTIILGIARLVHSVTPSLGPHSVIKKKCANWFSWRILDSLFKRIIEAEFRIPDSVSNSYSHQFEPAERATNNSLH